MKYLQVAGLDDLKALSNGENAFECFIALSFGARSYKRILYNEGGKEETWWIANEIDDTEESFSSDEEMLEKTNIGLALKSRALWYQINN